MKRPALTLVPTEPPDPRAAFDGLHRRYMGLRSEIKSERAQRQRLEADNAKLRAALVAHQIAFNVIAGAQESKRRDAGMEAAAEILRLAAGIADPKQFADWLTETETLVKKERP